jgi:4-aminobutyrate aminotransferase
MIGIQFPDHDASAAVEHRAFERGLLMLGCGDDAIRISPALNLREDQARTALDVFGGVVAEVESGA